MLPTNLLSFEYMTISGHREIIVDSMQVPAALTPQQCSASQRFDSAMGGLTSATQTSTLSTLNDISLAINALQKDAERAQVRVYTHRQFPLNTARPVAAPSIYERDQLEQLEAWQAARLQMLEIAYQTVNIFSISFLPEDPTCHQTWYLRKCCMQDPFILKGYQQGWIEPNTSMTHFVTEEKKTTLAKEDSVPLRPLTGMLKPYPTFSSNRCDPDLRLEDSSIGWQISAENNIPLPIEELVAGEFKDSMVQIAQLFMQDKALKVSIIYVQTVDALPVAKRLLLVKS
jgi:hypothetical protein